MVALASDTSWTTGSEAKAVVSADVSMNIIAVAIVAAEDTFIDSW